MRKYILFFLFLAFLVNRTCAETLSDSITIPEITVTANLFEGKLLKVTGGIAVLSLEQLKSQQLISLSNQLNTIPGVYMHEGTYTTNRIVIRGMGSRTPYSTNRIKAYLNDIPLTDGNGVSTLENIDGTSIGRLEVIKGPSSALFGSGLGGTLNLTTLQPDHTIEMETMLGNYSTRMLKLKSSYQKNDFAMSVSVNQINSNGYRENNKLKKYSALFTGYGLVGKSRISLTALYSNINAQIPSSITEEMFLNSPKSAAPNWFQAKGYEQSERFIVGTTLNSRLFNTVSNKATFFGGFSNSFERRPFNDLSDLSKTVGFRNQLKFQFTKAEAILGTEVFFENYLWQTQKDEILINRINENRKYGNLFGMMNFHPIEQLVVTGGININLLNYAYSNEISETEKYTYPIIVSPRVGLNYEFSKSVTSYASLGHGFSAPSLEETLMPNGNKNPNLKPEQGYQYELGFRVTALQNRFYLDLSNYIIQLNNLLLTKRISEENFFGANAGKTNHKGIEIQAFYEVLNSNSFPG
ncbi:MAG: TonB-dependent receptor, partial [Prolixibacteraceae bacterium]|nr:TonB-dependent receptor [Prolixibacteraceae bacterium]